MEAIYLLIPIALILVVVGVAIFFWAVKSDQFEDLEGPAHSILFDDSPAPKKKNSPQQDQAPKSGDDAKEDA
ncbi:MAG: cbb3-type cytochrome oxidase assembly protein CcoS [Pseudomonadales bacterium]|jgi:cbb3-type cytochrome oxidase maturation protein